MYLSKEKSQRLLNLGFRRSFYENQIAPFDYYEYEGKEWCLGGEIVADTLLAPKEVYENGTWLLSSEDLLSWLTAHHYKFQLTYEIEGRFYRIRSFTDENSTEYKAKGADLVCVLAHLIEKLLKQSIFHWFPETALNAPAKPDEMKSLITLFEQELPADYHQMLLKSNGLEGPIHQNGYFALYSIQEVIETYHGYNLQEELPDCILIGTDRGGMAYGYNRKDVGALFEIPFELIGMEKPTKVADTLTEFLETFGKEEDLFEELFSDYVAELRDATSEEQARIDRIKEKHRHRFASEDELDEYIDETFEPICCSGRVIAVFRKYWLLCEELNEQKTGQHVNPKDFAFDWLSGSNDDLYDIIDDMPYFPIGIDEDGEYC